VTKSIQDSSSGTNVIANDIQFRDTGVILKITPEIRQSGEVLLNIDQEVSRVVPTTSSKINSPTISQRKISSTVLVPDGTAIVLGGLMNSNQESGGGGLPGTPKTLLGALFGSSKDATSRSELIVIVRPKILQDRRDLRAVVEEVAQSMKDVIALR
jgi:general secretion pathway protein D